MQKFKPSGFGGQSLLFIGVGTLGGACLAFWVGNQLGSHRAALVPRTAPPSAVRVRPSVASPANRGGSAAVPPLVPSNAAEEAAQQARWTALAPPAHPVSPPSPAPPVAPAASAPVRTTNPASLLPASVAQPPAPNFAVDEQNIREIALKAADAEINGLARQMGTRPANPPLRVEVAWSSPNESLALVMLYHDRQPTLTYRLVRTGVGWQIIGRHEQNPQF